MEITEAKPLSKSALELAKRIANKLWYKYDDTYGYRTEKVTRNNEVSTDDPENMYFFWQQFDGANQKKFLQILRKMRDIGEKYEILAWVRNWIDEAELDKTDPRVLEILGYK